MGGTQNTKIEGVRGTNQSATSIPNAVGLSDPIIFRKPDTVAGGDYESFCWLGTGGLPGNNTAELILGHGHKADEPFLTNSVRLGANDAEGFLKLAAGSSSQTNIFATIAFSPVFEEDLALYTVSMIVSAGGNTVERSSFTDLFQGDGPAVWSVNSDNRITVSDVFRAQDLEIFVNGVKKLHDGQTTGFGIFNKANSPVLTAPFITRRWDGDNVRVINKLIVAFQAYGWLK